MIGVADAEDVDGVDETIHDAVSRFNADDELAAGRGERIIAEGGDGVESCVVVDRGGGGGLGLMGLVGVEAFRGGEDFAGLTEGGEGGEGSGWREPFSGLEEDVGSIDGLEREG